MKKLALGGVLLLLLGAPNIIPAKAEREERIEMYPEVEKYVEESIGQFDRIPEDRQAVLRKISLFIRSQIQSNQPVNLTFICTHNSRRSHLSQVWTQVAAAFYGIPRVTTYSGGTEATAFNPRAVAAVERAGLKVEKTTDAANPIYLVHYSPSAPPTTHFSKVYNYAPNPQEGFAAVMTCSAADQNCPMVYGSSTRFAIPFEDPKAFDDTEKETAAYDERCRQISREMLFIMSQVKE